MHIQIYYESLNRAAEILWNKMAEEVEKAVPQVWEQISVSATPRRNGEGVKYFGYTIHPPKFENFPPRITLNAELDLPETKDTNPRAVDILVRSAARSVNPNTLGLDSTSQYFFPNIESLEKDKVFGTTPEIPPQIFYTLKPDRDKFTKK